MSWRAVEDAEQAGSLRGLAQAREHCHDRAHHLATLVRRARGCEDRRRGQRQVRKVWQHMSALVGIVIAFFARLVVDDVARIRITSSTDLAPARVIGELPPYTPCSLPLVCECTWARGEECPRCRGVARGLLRWPRAPRPMRDGKLVEPTAIPGVVPLPIPGPGIPCKH